MKDTCIHVVREQLTVCLHWCYGTDKKKRTQKEIVFSKHFYTSLQNYTQNKPEHKKVCAL